MIAESKHGTVKLVDHFRHHLCDTQPNKQQQKPTDPAAKQNAGDGVQHVFRLIRHLFPQ